MSQLLPLWRDVLLHLWYASWIVLPLIGLAHCGRRSEGHPAFDDEVLRVVKLWTFTPATKSGRPVAARVQVPVRFSLR